MAVFADLIRTRVTQFTMGHLPASGSAAAPDIIGEYVYK